MGCRVFFSPSAKLPRKYGRDCVNLRTVQVFVKKWTEGKMSDHSFLRPLSSEEEEDEEKGYNELG